MDSFRGRTIDLQVFLLSITVHLLSFPSFGWRTNVGLSCKPREQARQPVRDAVRSVGDCQIQARVVLLRSSNEIRATSNTPLPTAVHTRELTP